MKFDFGGYATKNDIKCSDGRTIRSDAFKHNDGEIVPLVWQHQHNDPANVLGHALLENRKDGVYAFCNFNETKKGKEGKELVKHGDVKALSIYANGLVQKVKDVVHGSIREVSLVLSGANPGALIDNIVLEHNDGEYTTDATEAVIYTGESLETDAVEHAEAGKTVGDIFNEFDEQQKNVVYAMLAQAAAIADGDDMKQSGIDDEDDEDDEDDDVKHAEGGGKKMKKNVFEKGAVTDDKKDVLSHSDFQTIIEEAKKGGGSLKRAAVDHINGMELEHAGTYGVDNIGLLFPDAQAVTNEPDFIKRDTEWVASLISGTKHTPFSRIKSMTANITADEARAKGYVTGNEKTEEVFALLQRITTPTTIYKKQKLDRDDIIDITTIDVVRWLKSEMRVMLDEEIARAILIGDGREVSSEDKINESNIRPIYKEADLYAPKTLIPVDATVMEKIEAIIRARKNYKGTGRPNFYTTADELTEMLLVKDTTGRRIYKGQAELATDLRVAKIIEVEVMEGIERVDGVDTLSLVGQIFNPKDYTVGADKGGEINLFDDFDIDYNQYKYLMETRISGALTKPMSALIIEQTKVAG